MQQSSPLSPDLEAGDLPCAHKLAFDTIKQANAAAIVADWQHGASVKPYQCNHCQLWHLASA